MSGVTRYNPFRPGAIVTPGMFRGRLDELHAIERSLAQTRQGNPRHFLIQGERGIGKSSLLLYANWVARGQISSLNDNKFRFLVIEVELNSSTTDIDIVEKIGRALRRELTRAGDFRTLAKGVLDFLSGWKVLGVEFKRDRPFLDPIEAIEDFASALDDLMSCAGHILDGVVLLVDEADKPEPQTAKLGELVKHLTERLTRIGCEKICIGMAGLPSIGSKLRASHESSLRIFETLTLDTLSNADREGVVRSGLATAEGKNGYATTVQAAGLNAITHLSEGYPHFLQEFAYASFEECKGNTITEKDVINAIYKENGAMHQLGKRYFEAIYYERISSPDYRRVLQAMASHGDQWIPRQEIIQAAHIKESQVNNALNTLKSRNIIYSNDERRGEYRLPTKSFAVWLNLLGERADQLLNAPP